MDNSPTLTKSGQPHRAGHLLLLGLVCLAAFWLRSAGIGWPNVHPDEHTVGEWIKQTATRGYISEKVYAGGFFTLARPVQLVCRTIVSIGQAGAYHQGATDLPAAEHFDTIRFARWFNVWLGTLTCLFIYGLTRRITGSSGAGVLAAALFAFAQYPLEHAHYGETDTAMVFMLAIACWLWAIVIGNRRPFAFCSAALISGFAAGTKFPLILLAVITLIIGLAETGWPVSRRGFGRGLGYAGLGLGLFALGFILANPLTVMDWSGFQSGLAWESRRVYGETALNMGIMKNDSLARYYLHLRELFHCGLTLGWGWIILALIGIPCALLKAQRRFWPILLLFPALYTVYWIFFAPWVRTQEFMNYLPALAAMATLPLAILWRARRHWFRIMAALMACAALTLNAGNGLRVTALFGWTDTRLLARHWLEQHLPDTAKPAIESYAEPACPDTRNPPVLIKKIERNGLTPVKEQGADFLLRAANLTGRGLIHPVTGQLYPDAQRLSDEFQAQSELLAAWCPRSSRNLATFMSPTIELWGLQRSSPRHRLMLELPQPLLVNDVYAAAGARPTFFPIGHKLGSATGLLVDRRRRTAAIGGPPGRNGPVYLILNTEEREAAVHIRGCGRHETVSLAPYSVAIVPLRLSSWPGYEMPFERLTLEAAFSQESITYLPCYARLAYTPDEAARICAELGQPDAFWKTFNADDLAQTTDLIQRYVLAVNAGRWELANRWESAAVKSGAALTAALGAASDEVNINGNSGYYYDAMARVRLQEHGLSMMDHMPQTSLELILPVKTAKSETVNENTLPLPIRVAHGIYELSGELFVKTDPSQKPLPTIIEYTLNQRETWTDRYPTSPPDGWMPFAERFTVNTEIQPRLTVRSKTPVRLYFKNLELRWSLTSALESVSRSLAIARAAHVLHRGRPAEALALLAGLDSAPTQPDALEIRQLRFQALRGLEDRAAPRLADAAREVLTLAPDTYACLEALADKDPAARVRAEELRANLKQPLAAGPFLALVGGAFDPARREIVCVFEVLKNETPPLTVSLYALRHGAWRKRQSAPLSARPRLEQGERVALRGALNEKFDAAPDAACIALGIESDVQWHPSQIPIAGRRDAVIPLAELPR